MYHESEGPTLAASREERGYHHVRIFPAAGGFHVHHYRRANDPSPERHTFNSAAALAKHIKAIASIPGNASGSGDANVPSSEHLETEYGRARGDE
jgi:hypothetical protein